MIQSEVYTNDISVTINKRSNTVIFLSKPPLSNQAYPSSEPSVKLTAGSTQKSKDSHVRLRSVRRVITFWIVSILWWLNNSGPITICLLSWVARWSSFVFKYKNTPDPRVDLTSQWGVLHPPTYGIPASIPDLVDLCLLYTWKYISWSGRWTAHRAGEELGPECDPDGGADRWYLQMNWSDKTL